MEVFNTTRRTQLAWEVEVARSRISRLRGLLGRRGLQPGSGLLLVPCQGVHTLAMRFHLDVLFLDRKGRVLRVVPNVPPGRFTTPERGARAVLELPAGIVATSGTRPGDCLTFAEDGPADPLA